ncbi:MAG: signal peptidase II [Cyanobacteria bacterium SIG27]|nr:signal peptidase II [Cyanobacteria bacterium SIG27]
MKDKKACIFYFLMTIILLDFGNQLRNISYYSSINSVHNSFLSITHLNNTGSAFSMFQNQAQILAYFGIFVVLFVAFQVFKNVTFNDKNQLLALTLFSAGTLGNVIERFKFGYVVDYIKLNFINFPVFNAFDVMICLGIFVYCLYILLENKKVKNETN